MALLSVPTVAPDMPMREAAHAYAACGWFVLPVAPGGKHAGSVLGTGWPDKTSRDPHVIDRWFRRGDLGLAFHVGRSGAVVFDVDQPALLPSILADVLEIDRGPFQSTRRNSPGVGHYPFRHLDGVVVGNGKGYLQGGWGDVRGRNGIIVVAPTRHSKPEAGGRYYWLRTGRVPALPAVLSRALTRNLADLVRPCGEPRAAHAVLLPRSQSGRTVVRRLGRLLQYVLDSEPGQRNNSLHWASCRAGEMVGAGVLAEASAVQALTAAGRQVGLGEQEMLGGGTAGTIYSGLRSGRHG